MKRWKIVLLASFLAASCGIRNQKDSTSEKKAIVIEEPNFMIGVSKLNWLSTTHGTPVKSIFLAYLLDMKNQRIDIAYYDPIGQHDENLPVIKTTYPTGEQKSWMVDIGDKQQFRILFDKGVPLPKIEFALNKFNAPPIDAGTLYVAESNKHNYFEYVVTKKEAEQNLFKYVDSNIKNDFSRVEEGFVKEKIPVAQIEGIISKLDILSDLKVKKELSIEVHRILKGKIDNIELEVPVKYEKGTNGDGCEFLSVVNKNKLTILSTKKAFEREFYYKLIYNCQLVIKFDSAHNDFKFAHFQDNDISRIDTIKWEYEPKVAYEYHSDGTQKFPYLRVWNNHPNDGPGYRCDIYEFKLYAKKICSAKNSYYFISYADYSSEFGYVRVTSNPYIVKNEENPTDFFTPGSYPIIEDSLYRVCSLKFNCVIPY